MEKIKHTLARSYRQFCGLSRALDAVGDRWNLLIARDLLIGPMRFSELKASLRGIATNLLTERLRTLESAGIVERRLGDTGVRYALTPWGEGLRAPIESLAGWAMPLMASGRDGDAFEPRWLAVALPGLLRRRTMTPPVEIGFETDGDLTLIRIDEHGPHAEHRPARRPDTVLAAEPEVIIALAAGALTVEQALAAGRLDGDVEVLRAVFPASTSATGAQGERMSGDELAAAQRAHWQATYAAHPEMYGREPSAPARHAAATFAQAGARDILELGAGHGRDALFLARQGFTVTAADFSAEGLAQLAAAARKHDLAVTTLVHDVREPLPIGDRSVDGVFAHMMLTMALSTAELHTLVAEIRRVLRPGGVFVYTVRHTGDAHYGAGTSHGDGIFEHGGFAVHFFDRDLVDALADGWELREVEPFEEGDLPRRLWRVTQTAAGK